MQGLTTQSVTCSTPTATQQRHNTWAVKISSDGVVESLRAMGLEHMGAVFEHTDEYHVFKAPEHHDLVHTAKALESHEGVEWFRHQVPRERHTRFIESDPLYAASWFLHNNPGWWYSLARSLSLERLLPQSLTFRRCRCVQAWISTSSPCGTMVGTVPASRSRSSTRA